MVRTLASVILITEGQGVDMKTISFVVVVLAILAFVSGVSSQIQLEPVAKQKPPLKIVFPENKIYVAQETIKLIGTVSDTSIQQVNIQVAGRQLVEDGVIPIVKGAFEATVALQAGLNEISVSPVGKEGIEAKIAVFLKTDANAGEVPGDFREYFRRMQRNTRQRSNKVVQSFRARNI